MKVEREAGSFSRDVRGAAIEFLADSSWAPQEDFRIVLLTRLLSSGEAVSVGPDVRETVENLRACGETPARSTAPGAYPMVGHVSAVPTGKGGKASEAGKDFAVPAAVVDAQLAELG